MKAQSPQSGRNAQTTAFSSEVDAGSREERVKTKNRASVRFIRTEKAPLGARRLPPTPMTNIAEGNEMYDRFGGQKLTS